MIKVSVMYPNQPGVRFDHEYYRTKHLPLIKSRMGAALKYYTSTRRSWMAKESLSAHMSPCAICSVTRSTRTRHRSDRMPRKSGRDIPNFTDGTSIH